MMPDPTGGGVMIRDYRKGNWTLTETMVLIEAKKMNDDRRMKRINGGGGGSSSSSANKSGELRWKWVEDYCWRKGCFRSQNQCNDKWDNLMRDYKKVRDHQRRLANSSAGEEPEPGGNNNNNKSYWKMEKSERKDRNLPSNMLLQIYDALVHVVERPGGGGSGDQQPPPSGGGGGGSSSSGINASISNVNQVTTMEMSTAIVHQQPPSTSAATAGVLMPLPMLPHHHHPHHQAYLPITTALPLPPPQSTQPPPLHSQPQVGPPPPPHLVTHAHHYPIPTTCDSVDLDSDSDDTSGGEYTDSPAKRRRRSSPGGGEAIASASLPEETSNEVGRAISRIAEAIKGSEEKEERRHRDIVSLHERRLKIEESTMEITRRGINGLVDAINNLSHSILALASSSSPRDNKNQNNPSSSSRSPPK